MPDQYDSLETRAQRIGVKPKVLAARSKRSLASIRKNLEKLAEPYTDIDESVASALEVLLASFDEFENYINGTVEYLMEIPE